MLHWPKSVTCVTTKEKQKCITDYEESILWSHISNWKIETTEILVFPWDLNWSDATGEPCEEQCVWGREVGQHCHTWCAAGKSEGLPDYLLWLSGMTEKKKPQESWIYIWKKCHRCVFPLRSQRFPLKPFLKGKELDVTLWIKRNNQRHPCVQRCSWMHTQVNSRHPPCPRTLFPCHDHVN